MCVFLEVLRSKKGKKKENEKREKEEKRKEKEWLLAEKRKEQRKQTNKQEETKKYEEKKKGETRGRGKLFLQEVQQGVQQRRGLFMNRVRLLQSVVSCEVHRSASPRCVGQLCLD